MEPEPFEVNKLPLRFIYFHHFLFYQSSQFNLRSIRKRTCKFYATFEILH